MPKTLDYGLPMCSESSWLFGFTDSREEDAMAGMLWCEQRWELLPARSDSRCTLLDKVASGLPVTCLHTPRFHINSKHKNWRHIKRVHGLSHLLMNVSHSVLAGLVADRSVSVVPHQSDPRSQSLQGREKLDRRCFPGGLAQLTCAIRQKATWGAAAPNNRCGFVFTQTHNYIYFFGSVNPDVPNVWATPTITPRGMIGSLGAQSAQQD